MPSINETLADEFIRHQIYIERFKTGRLNDLTAFLATLMDDVSALLGKRLTDAQTAGTVRTERLAKLLKDLEELSNQSAEAMSKTVMQQLRDLSVYETGWTAATVNALVPVVVDFVTVAPSTLWAAVTDRPFEGRQMRQWFKDYTVSQRRRITEAVKMSVVEGETVDQTIRRIRGTQKLNYRDGIVQGINKRAAEALARTAINHTVTMARQETFNQNTSVVKGVLWRSTLDARTSEICMARDGKVYEVDKGPRPPAHPNCRSTITPVLKSWKELGIDLKEAPEGTRATMDGQVPASETYQTWLKRQPASFQDDVLGKTKGKLFRQGDLSVDRFVDENSGRGYTLDELRAKHPDAFKKAGLK